MKPVSELPRRAASACGDLHWRSLRIADAGLSTRATRALLSTYAPPEHFPPFDTMGQVAGLSDEELLRWPGVGKRVLEEIRGRARERRERD